MCHLKPNFALKSIDDLQLYMYKSEYRLYYSEFLKYYHDCFQWQAAGFQEPNRFCPM